MASQLIVKSIAAKRWNGRAVWVIQDTLAAYIASTTGLRLSELRADQLDEVNLLAFKYNDADDDSGLREMRGLDIYNPATGDIKSSGAGDIYCWFIDTDYDEQSFFVRQAYFCGGGKNPHKNHIAKLKADLRAEIDEDAWARMYATVSRPFAAPASGKIAVKAINHYGDEVIKVFSTND